MSLAKKLMGFQCFAVLLVPAEMVMRALPSFPLLWHPCVRGPIIPTAPRFLFLLCNKELNPDRLQSVLWPRVGGCGRLLALSQIKGNALKCIARVGLGEDGAGN